MDSNIFTPKSVICRLPTRFKTVVNYYNRLSTVKNRNSLSFDDQHEDFIIETCMCVISFDLTSDDLHDCNEFIVHFQIGTCHVLTDVFNSE